MPKFDPKNVPNDVFPKILQFGLSSFLVNNSNDSKELGEIKNLPVQPGGYSEREGFEPPESFPSDAFKAPAFDHSAISPCLSTIVFCQRVETLSIKKDF